MEVRVTAPDDEEKMEEAAQIKPPPIRNSLGVPQPIKSNIGVNNPLNKGLSAGPLPPPTGLFPMPGSAQIAGGSATGSGRKKVTLEKGFSMMDWIRLTKSGKDLTGVGGCRVNGKVREVTRSELKKHRKRKDAWMALNGVVFNVTDYMDFHPGGWDELVKGAGRDATDMFNEIHRWVNYQGLLEACVVGKLVEDPVVPNLPPPSMEPPRHALPVVPAIPAPPTFDFFETDSNATLNIYTKIKGLLPSHVTADCGGEVLRVLVSLPEHRVFLYHLQLTESVKPGLKLKAGASGKVEVVLTKSAPGRWKSLGRGLEDHLFYGPRHELQANYQAWHLTRVEKVTHNIRLLLLQPPPSLHHLTPPGHHVEVRAEVEEVPVMRSYTPVISLAEVPPEEKNWLRLMIKIYPMGELTPHLATLNPGEQLLVSEPRGSFQLTRLEKKSGILMLAAGTGITPILSLVNHLPTSSQPAKLLFFNRKESDIPWREEMEKLPHVSVEHVLSEQGEWSGLKGRISRDILALPVASLGASPLVLVCGPLGFNKTASKLLKEFEVPKEAIHVFQG